MPATLASASRHMCHGHNSMHAMTEHPCSLSNSRPAAELVTLDPRSLLHRLTRQTTCPVSNAPPPPLPASFRPVRKHTCARLPTQPALYITRPYSPNSKRQHDGAVARPPPRAHSPAAHQDGLAATSYQLASIAARTKKAFCEYQDLTRTGSRLPGNSRACRPS